MAKSGRKLERERRTIEAMIEVYCRGVHGSHGPVCDECAELMAYASKRLEKCPYQDDKPPCAKCPIHCYQPKRRDQVKAVMRYAGPRMLLRHPVFAIKHTIDSRRPVPDLPKYRNRQREK